MDWSNIYNMVPSLGSILAFAVKASVLLGLALAANILLRRAAASVRFFVLSAAVLMIPAAPFLSAYLPGWEIPVPAIIYSHPVQAGVSEPVSEMMNISAATESSENASGNTYGFTPGKTASPLTIPGWLWLAGTAIMLGRVVLGFTFSAKIRRRRNAVAGLNIERIITLADKISLKIGLRKKAKIILSDRVQLPQTHGLFKPAVILPSGAVHWSDARLAAVLEHELAHVKRKDHITWPLANIAVAGLWFNPLVWLVLSRMRLEREKACDDLVLGSGAIGVSYARHLIELCNSLRASMSLSPVGLMFARKNEMEERIMYMFKIKTNRRPMNLKKRFIVGFFLALIAVPLMSVHGFKADAILEDVTPAERDAILSTLAEFYESLSSGTDFESTRGRFLTLDYFADSELTFENLDKSARREAFDNTLSLLKKTGVAVAKEARGRVVSIRREGQEYIVTQNLNVIADRIVGPCTVEESGGRLICVRGESSKIEDCHLVDSLEHQIRFRKEDGLWKISKYGDGVKLMCMDTDNPYGPIFLVWMENIDPQITPFGPGVFKVIPADIVPEATNTKFILEN